MEVFPSDVSSVVAWDTSTVYDNGKDDEAKYRRDLDDRKYEFNLEAFLSIPELIGAIRGKLTFTITTYTKQLNQSESNEEARNPDSIVEVWSPIFDGNASSTEFVG